MLVFSTLRDVGPGIAELMLFAAILVFMRKRRRAPGSKKLRVGDRVRVSADAGWRQDAFGVVQYERGLIRTRQGIDQFYFVRFDTPQDDLSEDGPYLGGEILSRHLTKLPS